MSDCDLKPIGQLNALIYLVVRVQSLDGGQVVGSEGLKLVFRTLCSGNLQSDRSALPIPGRNQLRSRPYFGQTVW